MPNPASKPVIAVDVDDVLSLSADEFIRYTNKKWRTNLTIDDYTEDWAKIWKIDNQQEAEKQMHAYIKYTTHLVKRNQDAPAILAKLSKRYKLVIVTARRVEYQEDTQLWLKNHYGKLFSEIHYARIWDEVTKDRIKASKKEVLKEVGAQYLIDDQPKHCIAAAEAGIKALLFGDYGWNRETPLQPNMVRAKNWQEVLEYFENESAR